MLRPPRQTHQLLEIEGLLGRRRLGCQVARSSWQSTSLPCEIQEEPNVFGVVAEAISKLKDRLGAVRRDIEVEPPWLSAKLRTMFGGHGETKPCG